jgi:hypothetical protein
MKRRKNKIRHLQVLSLDFNILFFFLFNESSIAWYFSHLDILVIILFQLDFYVFMQLLLKCWDYLIYTFAVLHHLLVVTFALKLVLCPHVFRQPNKHLLDFAVILSLKILFGSFQKIYIFQIFLMSPSYTRLSFTINLFTNILIIWSWFYFLFHVFFNQ